jgi:hypothetical protein
MRIKPTDVSYTVSIMPTEESKLDIADTTIDRKSNSPPRDAYGIQNSPKQNTRYQ